MEGGSPFWFLTDDAAAAVDDGNSWDSQGAVGASQQYQVLQQEYQPQQHQQQQQQQHQQPPPPPPQYQQVQQPVYAILQTPQHVGSWIEEAEGYHQQQQQQQQWEVHPAAESRVQQQQQSGQQAYPVYADVQTSQHVWREETMSEAHRELTYQYSEMRLLVGEESSSSAAESTATTPAEMGNAQLVFQGQQLADHHHQQQQQLQPQHHDEVVVGQPPHRQQVPQPLWPPQQPLPYVMTPYTVPRGSGDLELYNSATDDSRRATYNLLRAIREHETWLSNGRSDLERAMGARTSRDPTAAVGDLRQSFEEAASARQEQLDSLYVSWSILVRFTLYVFLPALCVYFFVCFHTPTGWSG
jgi:hypothetical protein